MNNKILIVAIALPMVLVGAGSSLASDSPNILNVKGSIQSVKDAQITPNTRQPLLYKPSIEGTSLENTFQGNGDTQHPGPGVSGGKKPPGPRPPRREELNFQNPGAIVTPSLNSNLQNQNINVAPGQ